MQQINYNSIDWEFAKQYIKNRFFEIGGCSSVSKGHLFGRNYDFKYDDAAYFVITVNAKHRSIGITGGFPELTVGSAIPDDLRKALPLITLDGMNDAGVVASINLVPTGDYGITTGTTPTGTQTEELCQCSLVRYVLDNFDSASAAVKDISEHVSVYAPIKSGYEIHVMIKDLKETYVLEFIENELKVIRKPFMTNFYLYETKVDEFGRIDWNTVTDYGQGLERYDIIAAKYGEIVNSEDMINLMRSLNFTNAYKIGTTPQWKTEFTDRESGRSIRSTDAEFTEILALAREAYANRTRDGVTWQTCHTTVYDSFTKTMFLLEQEEKKSNTKVFTLPKEEIDTMKCIEYDPSTNVAVFSYHTAADIAQLPNKTKGSLNMGPVSEGSKAMADDKIEVYSLTAENTWVKIVG